MTTEVTDATATQPGAQPPPFDRELAPVVVVSVSLRAPDAYRPDNITEMRQPVPGASTTRHWMLTAPAKLNTFAQSSAS